MIFPVTIVINSIILINFHQTSALVELPKVDDNDIIKTESIIRDTTNNLFSTIKFHGKNGNPNLSRLSLIHSYLVTLTLKDYDSLTEVAKLTRVPIINDFNVTQHFIEVLNQIVNDNENGTKTADDDDEDDIVSVVNNYMHNLAYIINFYSTNSPKIDLQLEVLKYFDGKVDEKDSDDDEDKDETQIDDDVVEGGLETWKPEKLPLETRRIYQGKRTKIKHFPFMASVEVFGKFTCAGSIIEDDLVITAASCLQLAWNNRFYRETPAFLSIRIGSTFFESGGEKVNVLEIYFHPNYDPNSLHNNVAVMRLRRKIRFSRKNRKRVMKIEFDRYDHKLPSNTDGITVVGWGAKTSTNVIHNAWEQRLSYDILSIYGHEDCQEVYSKVFVTGKHFCAGFISKGGGACNRDVGGPGVVNGILTGIMSFGSPVCGAADSPTVFTKVGFYADWIEEIMDHPVVVGGQKTTTSEKAFDYNLAWEHPTLGTEAKARLIYNTKRTTEPYVEEPSTTEKRISENEIKELLSKILRNDNKNGFSSDSEENILREIKSTTLSPLHEKIMALLRESRKADDATEHYRPTTLMMGNVDPIVLFESEDSDDDYQEHSRNVTIMDMPSATQDMPPTTPGVLPPTTPGVLTIEQNMQLQFVKPVADLTIRQKLHRDKKSEGIKYHNNFEPKFQNVGNMQKKVDKIAEQRVNNSHNEIVDAVSSKKKSLKPDDVVLALLYSSDKDTKKEISEENIVREVKDSSTDSDVKSNGVLEKPLTKSSSESSSSDSDSGEDRLFKAGFQKQRKGEKKFTYINNATATTQSFLSNSELFEILSEALRENFNFTLPALPKSLPYIIPRFTVL